MMGHTTLRSRQSGSLLRCAVSAAALCTAFLSSVATARAQSFAYTLAQQYDPTEDSTGRGGFKLYLEDQSTTLPRPLTNLKMVLAVRDGVTTRYYAALPPSTNPFQYNRTADYQLKAVISPTSINMLLDGTSVKTGTLSTGLFEPADTNDEVRAGLDYKNTSGTTQYLIRPTGLTVATSGGQTKSFSSYFPNMATFSPGTYSLEPQIPIANTTASPTGANFHITAGQTVTITATFRLSNMTDATAQYPMVDAYGQYKNSDWPGKMHNWDDFVAARSFENNKNDNVFGMPTGYDIYGGYTNSGWSDVTGTGYFRTINKNGKWWLITPLGKPCFYLGVDYVLGTTEKTQVTGRENLFVPLPATSGTYASAWGWDQNQRTFNFPIYNAINRFGSNWEAGLWSDAKKRLRTWGFTGAGKWSGVEGPVQVTRTPVLKRGTTTNPVPKLPNTNLSDIYDSSVKAKIDAALREQIGTHATDPWIVGWSVGNEYEEIILASDIKDITQLGATVPAKKELIGDVLAVRYGNNISAMATAWGVTATTQAQLEAAIPNPVNLPAADVEHMRQHFAQGYYSFLRAKVKEIAPNHLYFGFWILPGWWENREDWRLMAQNCDVIGYDRYSRTFSDTELDSLMLETNKPVLLGEFSFPAYYNGTRGFGVFGAYTNSDAESGDAYAAYIDAAARNKWCIGVNWFQYHDQPITGRGIDTSSPPAVIDEHYAFGIVTITDNPKWDMIDKMRPANIQAVKTRLGQ